MVFTLYKGLLLANPKSKVIGLLGHLDHIAARCLKEFNAICDCT